MDAISERRYKQWFKKLKEGDKVDYNIIYDSTTKWRIGTIQRITYNQKWSKKKGFLDYARNMTITDEQYGKSNRNYTNAEGNDTISMEKKPIQNIDRILPLNTKTEFHQYLKYNNMSRCRYVNDQSKIGICYVCNKYFCTECVICAKCAVILYKKQILKCFQNMTFDGTKIEKKIIKIIYNFSVGIICLCCNDTECQNEIYFNNLLQFQNKYDCNFKTISYYFPKHLNNTLTYDYEPYSNNKIRIFCAQCNDNIIYKCHNYACNAKDNLSFCINNICYSHKCIVCNAKHIQTRSCIKCKYEFCETLKHLCGYSRQNECRKCIMNDEKKNMNQMITACNIIEINNDIIEIICSYAIGLTFICYSQQCNKCINFQSKFDYKKMYDINGDKIYYCIYKLNNLNDEIRIFCSVCTISVIKQCKICNNKGIFDMKQICDIHERCHLCEKEWNTIQCSVCMQYCCRYSGNIKCAMKQNDKVKCKKCWVSDEKKELQQLLINIGNYIMTCGNIANIISEYSLGYVIECCNEECSKCINFLSLFEYKNQIRRGHYSSYLICDCYGRCGCEPVYSLSPRKHWDTNGNECYAYPIKHILHSRYWTRPKYNWMIAKLIANNCKVHKYLGEYIRIFCGKCSKKTTKCGWKKGGECDNHDTARMCVAHRF